MWTSVLPMCMYMCVPCFSEEDIRSPGTGVTHSCEPPPGLGPLQEQPISYPPCHLSGHPWISFMNCLPRSLGLDRPRTIEYVSLPGGPWVLGTQLTWPPVCDHTSHYLLRTSRNSALCSAQAPGLSTKGCLPSHHTFLLATAMAGTAPGSFLTPCLCSGCLLSQAHIL